MDRGTPEGQNENLRRIGREYRVSTNIKPQPLLIMCVCVPCVRNTRHETIFLIFKNDEIVVKLNFLVLISDSKIRIVCVCGCVFLKGW